MKAFEARKGSIKPQYDSAIHDIQRAVGWGWKNTHVDIHGSLYPEVATMLAKDGYDVKIVTKIMAQLHCTMKSHGKMLLKVRKAQLPMRTKHFRLLQKLPPKSMNFWKMFLESSLKKRKMKKMMMKKRIPLIYLISLIPHSKASSSKICLSKI